jgi:5-methylthioadenosine/S-adenosylhomocysteine deaminase
MTDAPAQLVITGATVLLHDEHDALHVLPERTIVVRDGAIAAVIPDAEGAATPAKETIDARGLVAMPGFINGHTHSPMTMFRGAAEDVPLEKWFDDFIWPMEVNLTDRDVALGAELAVAEMLLAGVTTFVDHYFAMPAIAEVVQRTGIRANLGLTFFSDGETGLAESLAFALEYRGAAGGRITTSLAPHATYTVHDDDLRATAAAALEHDLMVHVHAAEDRRQTAHTRYARGMSPVAILEQTGVLEARTLIPHGVGIVPEDLPALMRHRDHVGVATAPRGYLKDSAIQTPVRLLAAAGVPVGLATDGAGSNDTLDVWESMTLLALTQKAFEADATWMTARQALVHAFPQGARAIGMQQHIGRLVPGMRADIVLADLSAPRSRPVHDLANTIVYAARSSDVVHTIVDGRVLVRDRRLTTIDPDAVVAELEPRLATLTDRSHGRTIQAYTG